MFYLLAGCRVRQTEDVGGALQVVHLMTYEGRDL